MPARQKSTATGAVDKPKASASGARSTLSEISQGSATSNANFAKKRKVADASSKESPKVKKPRKSRKKDANISNEDAVAPTPDLRPRLTTPDLEFDYDRSQLRDQRPTPGRVTRPRLSEFDVNEEWKQQFQIPTPEKPKGRLTAFQKEEIYDQRSLINPLATFHHSEVCIKRGPDGPPTYDPAGFELDWYKVSGTMKPKPYNKRSMMNSLERAHSARETKQKVMNEVFFVDGKGADKNIAHIVDKYVNDEISKDLGIPWHQIGIEQYRQWEARGFEKKVFEDWWLEPNEEEKKRMTKMLTGASFRKDL